MKKIYTYIAFYLISTIGYANANTNYIATINIGTLPSNFCANETLFIPFTASGFVNPTNTFIVELSDKDGNFPTSPVEIGFKVGTSGGFIQINITQGIEHSNKYKIRIKASEGTYSNSPGIDINCDTNNYYWVGSTGNWSDFANHWATTSGGTDFYSQTPTSNDNVIIDTNSFLSEGSLTIDIDANCNNFDWTDGSNNPKLAGNGIVTVRGNFILANGIAREESSYNFSSDKQNIQIDFGDNLLTSSYTGICHFIGPGQWSLASEITFEAINFANAATLNTNDYKFTSKHSIYSDGNANTLHTGTSEMHIADFQSNGMGITGASTWFLNSNSTSTLDEELSLSKVIIEKGIFNLSDNTKFKELVMLPGTRIALESGATLTVDSIFNLQGTRDKMISIKSQSPGNEGTIAITGAVVVAIDFVRVKDNIIDNNSSTDISATNALDDGNNTGWSFSTIPPLNYFWVGGSGNWTDNTAHWGKVSGGGGFRSSPPGPLDNVTFDASSFPSGGTVAIDANVEINDLIWMAGSGSTSPKIVAGYSKEVIIHGDFVLDNGVLRNIDNLIFESSSTTTHNINFADNKFSNNNHGSISLQGGGKWQLSSPLVVYTLNLFESSFTTNGNSVEIDKLDFRSDASISNWGDSDVTILSSVTNSASNPQFSAGASTFFFKPYYLGSLYGYGGLTFNNVQVEGSLHIKGSNKYANLTLLPGSKLTLENGFTQQFSDTFNANGLRNQPITIKSDFNGNTATISKIPGGGTFDFEYLNIEDIEVSGAGFTADYSTYNGVTNHPNINGWSFGELLESLDFYWVNNSGNWSDFATHWAVSDGSSTMHSFAPGVYDNVFFTENSFSNSSVVTLDFPVEVNNINWNSGSGANSPAFFANYNPLIIHGDINIDDGVQRNISSIQFISSNTQTINFGDNQGNVKNSRISFSGGGTWNMESNIKAENLVLQDATLNTNDFEVRLKNITLSNSSAVLNLGTSNIFTGGIFDNTGASAAINAGTSTIFVNNNDDDNGTFNGPSLLNNVTVLKGATLYPFSDFNITNLTLNPGSTLQIRNGATLTTSSITANGTSDNPIRIKSDSPGLLATISQSLEDVSANYLLISDNTAQTSGSAKFAATNSINAGNTGGLWALTAPTPKDYYWIGGAGEWSDRPHWATSDGGSEIHETLPGMSDNIYFTPNSFLTNNETIKIDQDAYCNSMTWTTNEPQSPSLFGLFDVSLNVFGSFTLANGVKREVVNLVFESYTTGNVIDFANNLRSSLSKITFKGNGEWTLESDLEARNVRFLGKSFNTGGFTIKVDEWEFSGGEPMYFNAENSNIYTSEFINNSWGDNLNFNAKTSTLHLGTPQSAYSQISGSFDFNNIIIRASATISSSNTFNSFTINSGATVTLPVNGIQLINTLSINGTENSPVIIKSSFKGNQALFSVPSNGVVTANYVILEDNRGTGGANFTAENSSQINNVTGWSGLLKGQVINFLPLNDINLNDTLELNATSTSGLPVSFTVNPITGSGSISEGILTPTTSGLVKVVASQAGNATYGSAEKQGRYVHLNVGANLNELGQFKQASYVIGAPNGFLKGYKDPTNVSVVDGMYPIISPDGKLIVGGASRVMIWEELPDDYDVPADVVVGQANFTSLNESVSQSVLAPADDSSFSGAVAIGPDGQLIVSDSRGVLIWNTFPTTNGAPADVIIGQTNFTSTTMAVDKDKFMTPSGIAVSNDGKLIVCDATANRVLIFNTLPTTNGAVADIVIGQSNFVSSTVGTTAKNLNFPISVAVSPTNKLIISDVLNNRVLIFNTIPTANYASADIVIGQNDFTSNESGIAANKFNFPMGVAISRTGKLAITDFFNRRALIYNQLPINNTAQADIVLGQADFTSNNNNPIIEGEISLRDIALPRGIFWDASENLLIIDPNLARVMVYGAKDLEKPTINSSAPLAYEKGGTSQTTNFTVTDRSGIASATGYWQEITALSPASPAYEQVALTNLGNDVFEFDLSVVETKNKNPIGIEYFAEFIDNAGNFASTSANKQLLAVNYPDGIPIKSFGVGNKEEDYRLMTVPLELADATVENVFSEILGGSYNNTKMRVFSYAGGASTTFDEATGSTNMQIGKGYFALAATAANVSSKAGTSSFSTLQGTSPTKVFGFSIDLVNGWNLIGNPFQHDVNWSDIETLSGITSGEVDQLQNYNGSWNASITSIKVGEGVFVHNNTGANFTLKIPAKNNVGGRRSAKKPLLNSLIEASWQVEFKANGTNGDKINLGGIGMAEDATYSKDMYDLLNPPSFGKMKIIEFNHPEFITPSFKKDVRTTALEEKWTFEYSVENPLNEPQTIYWDNSYFGKNTPDLYLVDKTYFTTINMKEDSTYTFSHGNVTKFEVYFGYDALEQIIPTDLITQSPFPNPFTHEITFNIGLPQDDDYSIEIKIFDAVGKLVRNISQDNISSGYNSITWDGYSKDGRLISAGIYAYSIHINGSTLSTIKTGKVIKR